MESDSARAYRIDPGGELLELGGAGAEVVGDAAGDEEAQGSGEAVADGADQAQRHQRPVYQVRVHEHRHGHGRCRRVGLLRGQGISRTIRACLPARGRETGSTINAHWLLYVDPVESQETCAASRRTRKLICMCSVTRKHPPELMILQQKTVGPSVLCYADRISVRFILLVILISYYYV